jgi:hypothetical protein
MFTKIQDAHYSETRKRDKQYSMELHAAIKADGLENWLFKHTQTHF